jgi:hypothetical protein
MVVLVEEPSPMVKTPDMEAVEMPDRAPELMIKPFKVLVEVGPVNAPAEVMVAVPVVLILPAVDRVPVLILTPFKVLVVAAVKTPALMIKPLMVLVEVAAVRAPARLMLPERSRVKTLVPEAEATKIF